MVGSLGTIALHLLALTGTPIQRQLQCGPWVTLYDHTGENDVIYTNLDAQVASDFPNVYKLDRATKYYNCHSFAFYRQYKTQRNYELYGSEVEDYALPCYTEVSFSSVIPGDKILYYSQTWGVSYLEHSGIVTKKLGGSSNYTGGLYGIDLLYVDSKWGERGLYKHKGHDCIYVGAQSNYNTVPAAFVKFYRSGHWHNYSYIDLYQLEDCDETFHFKSCSCGGYYEEHNYVPYNIYTLTKTGEPQYISAYRCSLCDHISYYGEVSY